MGDDDFQHLNMVTIIDTEGRIIRQVFGIVYKPEDIIGPVRESLSSPGPSGALPLRSGGGLLETLKYLCYTYDETTGTYKFDYNFIGSVLMGLFMWLLVGGGAILYIKRAKRARRLE